MKTYVFVNSLLSLMNDASFLPYNIFFMLLIRIVYGVPETKLTDVHMLYIGIIMWVKLVTMYERYLFFILIFLTPVLPIFTSNEDICIANNLTLLTLRNAQPF